jgi:hypothetical protein
MLLDIDRPITAEDTEHRNRALRTYKKITVIRVSQRCGLCGTTRHATKGFWSLGMRVCKHCVQVNLISSKVLFDRYWVHMGKPIGGYPSFVDAVASRVFYFENRTTPAQRMDFTVDPCDYPGGMRSLWFFWRPHLAKVVDMEQLAVDAEEKHAASALIRSAVRRSLIQRRIRGAKGNAMIERTRRSILFQINKTQLMDRVSGYTDLNMVARLNSMLFARLHGWEDRVIPSTTYEAHRVPG